MVYNFCNVLNSFGRFQNTVNNTPKFIYIERRSKLSQKSFSVLLE